MSCFKRAEWRSGLTYQQTCKDCGNVMTYKDNILDFRPWFADGFVYCSKCKKPLRHSELYAIDAPAGPIDTSVSYETAENIEKKVEAMPDEAFAVPESLDTGVSKAGTSVFCTQCGKKFNDGDKFCSECGAKRI